MYVAKGKGTDSRVQRSCIGRIQLYAGAVLLRISYRTHFLHRFSAQLGICTSLVRNKYAAWV